MKAAALSIEKRPEGYSFENGITGGGWLRSIGQQLQHRRRRFVVSCTRFVPRAWGLGFDSQQAVYGANMWRKRSVPV